MNGNMTDMAITVFCAALDAVLNDADPQDLSSEILARAPWVNDPLSIQAMRVMVEQSDGRLFGRPHLDRLRQAFLLK